MGKVTYTGRCRDCGMEFTLQTEEANLDSNGKLTRRIYCHPCSVLKDRKMYGRLDSELDAIHREVMLKKQKESKNE